METFDKTAARRVPIAESGTMRNKFILHNRLGSIAKRARDRAQAKPSPAVSDSQATEDPVTVEPVLDGEVKQSAAQSGEAPASSSPKPVKDPRLSPHQALRKVTDTAALDPKDLFTLAAFQKNNPYSPSSPENPFQPMKMPGENPPNSMDTSTMVSPNMPKLAAYLFKQADTADALKMQADAYNGMHQSVGGNEFLTRALSGNIANNWTTGALRPIARPLAKTWGGAANAIFGNPATVDQEKGIMGGVHRFWNNNRLGRALSEGRGGFNIRTIPDVVANSWQTIADAPLVQRYLDNREQLHGRGAFDTPADIASFVYPSDPLGFSAGAKFAKILGAGGRAASPYVSRAVGKLPPAAANAVLKTGRGTRSAAGFVLPLSEHSTQPIAGGLGAAAKEGLKHSLVPGITAGAMRSTPDIAALAGSVVAPKPVGKLQQAAQALGRKWDSLVDLGNPGYAEAMRDTTAFNPYRPEDRKLLAETVKTDWGYQQHMDAKNNPLNLPAQRDVLDDYARQYYTPVLNNTVPGKSVTSQAARDADSYIRDWKPGGPLESEARQEYAIPGTAALTAGQTWPTQELNRLANYPTNNAASNTANTPGAVQSP